MKLFRDRKKFEINRPKGTQTVSNNTTGGGPPERGPQERGTQKTNLKEKKETQINEKASKP